MITLMLNCLIAYGFITLVVPAAILLIMASLLMAFTTFAAVTKWLK